MKIDPEGKQLQIDDLIIIPNNLAATPPEGGSALQNLAKIASRYQNQKENPTTNPDMIWNNADSNRSSSHHQHHQENLTTDYSSSSMAKKPKLDHSGGLPSTMIGGGTSGGHAPHHNNPTSATPPTNKPVVPPPPTTPNAAATAAAAAAASSAASLAALAAMNPMSMTPAQQQSLLSMLPPGLFGMPTTPTKATSNHPSKDYSLNNPHHSSGGAGGLSSSAASTPTKSTAAVSSAAAVSGLTSGMAAGLLPPGLGDPSKLGPEALQLLQLYEKTLKAVVGGQTAAGALSASSLTMPSKSNLGSSSPKPRNASGSSSNAGSPQLQSAKDRDRNKVNRLPLDAKKPLAPQGHIPSAFAQSSTIYTNPLGM